MSKLLRAIVLSAAALLCTGSGAWAEESYGKTIGLKAGSGFSNILLGLLEVPKNIVKTSNDYNLLLGVAGGTVKGTAHALGRMMSGLVDVLTFPVPTKPITTPPFVWEDWYTETGYGPYFPTKDMAQTPAPRGMSATGRRY